MYAHMHSHAWTVILIGRHLITVI